MSLRNYVRVIASYLPEVDSPKRRVNLKSKFIWTGVVAVIYLIMASIPLYGVKIGEYDPLAFYRIILASTHGTLMELGIGPIVTAGLIMELLAGGEIIKVDLSKPEDRAFFTSATKLLTIVFAFVESMAFLISGFFGISPSPVTSAIIILQLMTATMIVMYLDELLQKGWGLGSGISLFIVLGVAEQIFWNVFSPVSAPIPGTNSTAPFGLIPYMAYLASTGQPISNALLREGYPSVVALLATIVTAFVIIYAEGIRIEIPISHARFRGFRGRYPVKLLYVSNIPVILASALTYNIYALSRIIWAKFNPMNANPWLNMFAMFNVSDPNQLTGGLIYYITAPSTIQQAFNEPLRAITFVALMCFLSTVFAIVWVEVGGFSPEIVSRQLIESGLQIPGFRRSSRAISMILEKYVRTVTIIGGFLVGLIAGVAQIVGVFGGGMGILLAIDILLQYYQLLIREQVEEMYPMVSKLIGR
ncbi:preprotein translocase subunit SecY [Candidatus Geothermarchaeota archaeon]|nr:MAG: preprotein translocase subunit SecY [Candidatus Geothermarchaeota archaeon]